MCPKWPPWVRQAHLQATREIVNDTNTFLYGDCSDPGCNCCLQVTDCLRIVSVHSVLQIIPKVKFWGFKSGDYEAHSMSLLLMSRSSNRCLNSVQFKMVFMRSEKPICAPFSLSEVFPTLPLKRSQCLSDWRWPSLDLSRKIYFIFPILMPTQIIVIKWWENCQGRLYFRKTSNPTFV